MAAYLGLLTRVRSLGSVTLKRAGGLVEFNSVRVEVDRDGGGEIPVIALQILSSEAGGLLTERELECAGIDPKCQNPNCVGWPMS